MPTESANQTLGRLDEIIVAIEADQATILQIVAASLAAHQAVDAEFSPQLNPLYQSVWKRFLEAKAIAEAHQEELLTRGRRSSKRNTGTIGWRAHSEVVLHIGLSDLIARIRAKGQTVSRKLLRRIVTWELRVNNIKAAENADLVAGIDGVEVIRADHFYVDPRQGFRVSDANAWWPVLDGQTGIEALQTLFRNAGAPPEA